MTPQEHDELYEMMAEERAFRQGLIRGKEPADSVEGVLCDWGLSFNSTWGGGLLVLDNPFVMGLQAGRGLSGQPLRPVLESS